MPRKFLRKHLPDVATVRSYRVVSMFGAWLHHPNLWCLNRRSVPGAVAIGLFCGLIPGPFQMLGALLVAVPLRNTIPWAALAPLHPTPPTIVPLTPLPAGCGHPLLGIPLGARPREPFLWDWANIGASLGEFAHWTMALGKPLVIGLVALAAT